ncbi:hypothetical protein DF034_02360 [Burkholderia anthina]|nr:hypothetical protein CFB35_20270 [Burkholderia sp. AU16482]RQV81108.1 hypothetical protein DF160_15515 [Burkholderia anthina]RQX84871.1 hypothetical protein DF034_02360 [Burkholderia anthina]
MQQRPAQPRMAGGCALSLNGFQTSRCRLQAKIITRNLEIFGDVSARNIEPEQAVNPARKRQ